MALQLYVKLQTPTIELPIKAKDAAGNRDSFFVGFKRYPLKEAKIVLDKLQELYNDYKDSPDEFATKLDSLIKKEVVYIKGIKLDTIDDTTGRVSELHIPDTRQAKPIETLWASPEECLDVLLDHLLECGPIRVSLNEAMTKALLNSDFEEDKVKNS